MYLEDGFYKALDYTLSTRVEHFYIVKKYQRKKGEESYEFLLLLIHLPCNI